MQIAKINLFNVQSKNNTQIENNKTTNPIYKNNFELPNYKQIAFEGIRVDKGLERFFNANKDRMPITVYRYVEALVDKTKLTPLEAQRRAFSMLENVEKVSDIKIDDDLFKTLINPEESKATRGILGSYRENKELLDMYNNGILSDNQNLTVYLVKKIFLEGKTLDEINKDFAKDIDKEFLALYRSKNPNSEKLIQESTLKALGIQTPDASYQQSLRYTRDGYSDMVGETISKAQRLFWDSLTPEQRTMRAKKSVEKFENWWAGLTYKQKMDMLAEQDNQLKMLKEFKYTEKKATPKNKNIDNDDIPEYLRDETPQSPHTKVGSTQLSKDELFIRWASNNLKIFEEGLSEKEKEALKILRINKLVEHWGKMSPAERTDYIQKLKSGAEQQQYIMIDAWNNSREIILELSKHLKESQILKPHDMLYSDKVFSEFQSRVMTAFWEEHPDFAIKLGEQIKLSQQKVKNAIESGTFEKLKKEIEKERSRRINEIVALKTSKPVTPQTPSEQPKPAEALKPAEATAPVSLTYEEDFLKAFASTKYGSLKIQPTKYAQDYAKVLIKSLPQDVIELWTKYLKGETLNYAQMKYLQSKIAVEPPEVARMNRAYEAAMAEVFRTQIGGNPKVYELSQSDMKTVMYHVERGECPIQIFSHKNNKEYVFDFIPDAKKMDKKLLNKLYETYVQDVSPAEIEKIIDDYYITDSTADSKVVAQYRDMLHKYIDTYGKSILIEFPDKSKYPDMIRYRFSYKFLMGMPEELKKQSYIRPLLLKLNDFSREDELSHYRYLFSKKYDFMPLSFLDMYFDKIARGIRCDKSFDINSLEKACQKRSSATASSRMLTIRHQMADKKDEVLAMEQALADALYEVTGEPRVYSVNLEMLMDKAELFKLAKSFPTTPVPCLLKYGGDELYLSAKKPINLRTVSRKYQNYLTEIKKWRKELNGAEPENYNEMLFILNPENGKEMIDLYTGIRMASFGCPTKVGKVDIHVK